MAYTEADIRAKYIDPAIKQARWDDQKVAREVPFTNGRIIVRGKTISRGEKKRPDYVLYHKPNLPIAIIEAKGDSRHRCRRS